MKGEQLLREQETPIPINAYTMTDQLEVFNQSMNTQRQIDHSPTKDRKESLKPIIPSELVLEDVEDLEIEPISPEKPVSNEPERGRPVPANLFGDLVDQQDNIDDHFEICDEEEEINIGQAALNIQIKDLFNTLRREIEKVFNGEELSISVIKELPRQLEDDFTQMISYIK